MKDRGHWGSGYLHCIGRGHLREAVSLIGRFWQVGKARNSCSTTCSVRSMVVKAIVQMARKRAPYQAAEQDIPRRSDTPVDETEVRPVGAPPSRGSLKVAIALFGSPEARMQP